MKKLTSSVFAGPTDLSNGSGAAAILAAGIGSFLLALLAIAADNSAYLKSLLNFYKPSGPLSGVTTTTVVVWLIVWGILEWRWRNRTVALGRINAVALLLLGLSLLLTFPPIADLF
ncbi:MAG: hypothetical protein WAK26_13635 [Terracidiphilus sp.]|jgi:hypothetical protein